MRKLLNTLYITSPDKYLALDGKNIVIYAEKKEIGRMPLHNLESIVTFGYSGVSPALMGACVENNIFLYFMSQHGKFLAQVSGEMKGNVILRKEQYRISDNEEKSCGIAKNIIIGKVFNSRWVLERMTRDYPMRIDVEHIKQISKTMNEILKSISAASTLDELRGLEGNAASQYFSVFDNMILQNKNDFYFHERNKRPPVDNVNAMLSFMYSILAGMAASALSTVGLDPFVGFLHRDRPGRISLALDIMEELRSVLVDRFVLSLINKKVVSSNGFIKKENGAVIMTDDTKKTLLDAWQSRKQETIKHPFLEEKIQWGLVPYSQAMLLARYIRGDLDEYPPFMWK